MLKQSMRSVKGMDIMTDNSIDESSVPRMICLNQRIKSHEYIYKTVQIIYNSSAKGGNAMSITATELKQNLGKYLLLSVQEDIYITKNGRTIAKLTNPNQSRVDTAKSLFGILPQDADIEEARGERLALK